MLNPWKSAFKHACMMHTHPIHYTPNYPHKHLTHINTRTLWSLPITSNTLIILETFNPKGQSKYYNIHVDPLGLWLQQISYKMLLLLQPSISSITAITQSHQVSAKIYKVLFPLFKLNHVLIRSYQSSQE